MICVHCDTPVPDGANFCLNCGSQVSDAEGQAAASLAMDASATLKAERLLREDLGADFKVIELLGRGGMALVFLAEEVHLSRRVAIKVLPPELTFGHGTERFIREAKTAASLDHPHIIPIYRISSGGQIFWYAMKFLDGTALDDVLKKDKRLPLDETIRILGDVADALDFAHRRDVIHRDIKPANVMLDREGRVVVTDFGIAKPLAEGTLTASGAVVGTPYYMSPEQSMGSGVTGASDQYSLAVMAYEMLCGQRPFDGDSAISILQKHVMHDAPPLDVLVTDLPDHVCTAVHRGLEKKPADRYSTCTSMIEAMLDPAARDVTERTTEPQKVRRSAVGRMSTQLMDTQRKAATMADTEVESRAAAAPRRRGRSVVMVLVASVLLAGGGAGWWFTLGPGGAPVSTFGPQPVAPAVEARAQGAPNATIAAAQATAIITGMPVGGTVAVDGGDAVSDTLMTVIAGPRVFQFSAPGFVGSEDTVELGANDTVVVAFSAIPRPPEASDSTLTRETPPPRPRQGRLIVQVVEGGFGRIFIDDEFKFEGPGYGETVLPGDYVIRVEREGFTPAIDTVQVTAGDTVRVRSSLRRQNP